MARRGDKLREHILWIAKDVFLDARPFLSAKLWDVANSAPYGHRGDLDTIFAAIIAHGGEATSSEAEFAALPDTDQAAIVTFLKTLAMPIISNNPNRQQPGSPKL
jgi:hypothetical protein